jgi:hypothetical protein
MWFCLLALLVAIGAVGCSDGDSSSQGGEATLRVPESRLPDPAEEQLLSLEEAAELTQAYGEVLDAMPSDRDELFSTSRLPEPKVRIRGALFHVLDSVGTEKDVEFLKAGLQRLAYFQDGVEGTAALSEAAPDGRLFQEIVEAEVSAIALELALRGYGAPPN